MRLNGHFDMQEILIELLQYARPDGEAHKRLTKYLDQVERNVFLAPSSFEYIQKLVEKTANIECNFLDKREEMCRKIGKPCPHADNYRACGKYAPRKADKIQGGDYGQ